MRIGFVGAGAIVQHHLAALVPEPDVQVGAVCDLDPGRAGEVGGRSGASVYSDWREMLDAEALDAVFVCTPPGHHAEPALEAMRRGLAVYLEKPLARAIEDGRAIEAGWRESGVVCAVGYQWRSLEVLERVRRELAGAAPGMLLSHSIGPTEAARDDLAGIEGGSWFVDPSRSGGILFELGSHSIDLQLAVAGRATSVQAMASSGLLALAGAPAGGLDDAVSVLLRFAGGGLGAVHVAWMRRPVRASYTLEVMAERALMHVELDPDFRLTGSAGGAELDVRTDENPRRTSVARFLAAVRAGDPGMVACSPADALHTLEVALAAERAIESGERVELRPSGEQR
jgi:myo-inositol 2-dehydrogenase / D-chiro-inositol 1-dehydrogenase